ncbi:hypothetical protein TRIUR3_31304 [Triticum urartu]|uniref:Uncharacterized protein n=1 Tax=Triticum urartu TaxID=4572 RepID=M8A8T1_TRIUA|nr:hypothetical protein TRIUR3_31304 [Triticum urartu]
MAPTMICVDLLLLRPTQVLFVLLLSSFPSPAIHPVAVHLPPAGCRLQPDVPAPGASTPRPPSSVPQKSVNRKASKTHQLESRSTSVAENVHELLCYQFLRSTVGCGSLLGAAREGAMQQVHAAIREK